MLINVYLRWNNKRYGLKSFSYQAASIWKSLLNDLRQTESYPQFRKLLRSWRSPNVDSFPVLFKFMLTFFAHNATPIAPYVGCTHLLPQNTLTSPSPLCMFSSYGSISVTFCALLYSITISPFNFWTKGVPFGLLIYIYVLIVPAMGLSVKP